MKSSVLFALVAVLLLQISASLAQQPAAKARIEGFVLRAGNGEAITGARLTLNRGHGAVPGPPIPAAALRAATPPKPIPFVVTDDQGRFAIPDLDEGSYSLQVLGNGYVSLNYGQRFPGGPGTPINLKSGQTLKDLTVTLTPASNISGRVRDRSDQPLADVPVKLLRYSYNASGQATYQNVGDTKTNDRGDYRIYWITPGRYYLMAGTPGSGSSALLALMAAEQGGIGATNPNQNPVALGYTFYPGASDIGSARPIELLPGADLDSMNMTLLPKPPAYRIRGRIIDSRTGQPPARAVVTSSSQTPGLSNGVLDQISMQLPVNNYNASTGAFEIRDLLSGSYTVTAASQDALAAGPRGGAGTGPPTPLNGSTSVNVSDSDLEGVTITVIPAVTIPGRIRVEGQLPVTLDRMRVQLTPRNPGPSPLQNGVSALGAPATVADDGTFRFVNVAMGDYRVLTVSTGGVVPPGARPGANAMYIKEARLEGTDVLNAPLRISGSVTGTLEIVLGVGGGQVSGVVNDRKSQPVPVTQVVLIPDRVRDRLDLYRTASTDENGRFNFAGVVPGQYKVFSWDGLEQYAWFDPELILQSETKGVAVQVTDTSSDTIEVKLIPKEGAQ